MRERCTGHAGARRAEEFGAISARQQRAKSAAGRQSSPSSAIGLCRRCSAEIGPRRAKSKTNTEKSSKPFEDGAKFSSSGGR